MCDVTSILARERILPVVTIADVRHAVPIAESLQEGGSSIIEVMFRTPPAERSVGVLSNMAGITVGAGTILNADQARRAIDAGARFVVSPGFDEQVVQVCQESGVAVFPGVATATEIQAALRSGLDVVKFLPAELLGGHRAVATLSAAFPGMRFIPTGGVGPSNVASYLVEPSVLAVGGTWLVPQRLVSAGDFDGVRQTVSHALDVAAGRG